VMVFSPNASVTSYNSQKNSNDSVSVPKNLTIDIHLFHFAMHIISNSVRNPSTEPRGFAHKTSKESRCKNVLQTMIKLEPPNLI